MKTETTKMISKMDQLALGVLVGWPEGEPVGIVQISHGMCERKERYLPFLEFLCGRGYVCVIHDHRGHGESVRSPEDLGYFYENGHQAVVEDVHQINQWMQERYPQLPFFLFGHSMGSLVVRNYIKKYDDTIDGLMVCGSPSATPASKLGLALSAGLKKRRTDRYVANRFNRIAFGNFNRKFLPVDSENAWLCSDPKVVAEYDQDPLCGFVFTINGFESLFHLMEETYNPKGWKVANPSLPIWFLAGEDDPCLLSRVKFLEAVDFIHKVGYETVSAKLYPGMRHEILNEIRKETVFHDVVQHLDAWRARKEAIHSLEELGKNPE